MVRSVGLWRAVVHRSRADWPVVTAAFVLLVCAVGLLTTGALYGETVALGGLRQAVLAAPPADRAIVVRTSAAPAEVAALDQTVFDQLGGSLSTVGGEVDLVVATDSLAPAGMDTTTARGHLTRLASYAQLDRHADLVAGRWAEPGHEPLEATLSDGAAAALGLGIGDEVKLARGLDPSQVVTVTVVGVWRPRPDDGYFLGEPARAARRRRRGRRDDPRTVRADGRRPDLASGGHAPRSRMARPAVDRRLARRPDRSARGCGDGAPAGAPGGVATAARADDRDEAPGHPGRRQAVDPRQPERDHPADDPVRGPRRLRRPARRRTPRRAASIRDGPAALARGELGPPGRRSGSGRP